MKYLVLLALIGGVYYSYMEYNKQTLERPYGPYKIETLSEKPMPKDILVEGDKFYAKDSVCNERPFQSFSGKSAAECQAYVDERHAACKAQSLPTMPELMYSQADMEKHGMAYLNCVLPKRG